MSEVQELPRGWVWTRLGTITKINPGIDTIGIDDDTFVSFVPMGAVGAGTGYLDATTKRPFKDVRRGYTSFKEGDVLFAKITPCMENGKSAVARLLSTGLGYGSTEFHVLRPLADISSSLIYFYISRESFRRDAKRVMTGSAGQLRVPASYLSDVIFPLPPLSEQQRIVEALELHLSRLDAGTAALRSTQKKLKRYRASVLKAAVEGKLTEEWRKSHSEIEPASKLLTRILAERRAKWEEEQRAKGRDLEKVKYEEPEGPDVKGLPEGWCWTSLGQCFNVHVGATPSRKEPAYWRGSIPWVSSGEVQFNRIKSTREYITLSGLNNSSTQLNPAGSVLLGMIGEGKTRGQVALLDIEASNNQNCAAIWVSQTPIIPEYIYYRLWSQYEVTRRGNSGNNQPALNKFKVEQIAFPLPPLAEQEQIVLLVEERLSIISTLESTIGQVLKRAERMRQSILHKAFTGQLVPQDPNDEPASVLLERIHQEREQAKPPQKLEHPTTRKPQVKSPGKRVAESAQPYLPMDIPDPQPLDAKATIQSELWSYVDVEPHL